MGHYGDQKTYKGRGGWGGGGSINYDAEDRRRSKEWYDKVRYSTDPAKFLQALSSGDLTTLVKATKRISRYGDYDWNRIVALVPDGEKEALMRRIEEAREEAKQQELEDRKRRDAESAERRARWDKEAEERRRKEAERKREMVNESRLMAGYLHSEFAEAIRWRETYGHDAGDWLDDPVGALTGQGGFGEEVRYGTGIRLEVNLALDCSNSMYHNDLSGVAVNTFRTLYLALDLVRKQLPDSSLVINAWLWAKGDDGKQVTHLDQKYNWKGNPWGDRIEVTSDNPLGAMEGLPSEDYRSGWTGEDTWLYPLLERIEKWENVEGDPGAFRLDIILTDGVLEHPTDSRKGDTVQYRRDGNLQSVVLNFLPSEAWADYKVPDRCVQYPATPQNIAALMRQVLGDWLTSSVM